MIGRSATENGHACSLVGRVLVLVDWSRSVLGRGAPIDPCEIVKPPRKSSRKSSRPSSGGVTAIDYITCPSGNPSSATATDCTVDQTSTGGADFARRFPTLACTCGWWARPYRRAGARCVFLMRAATLARQHLRGRPCAGQATLQPCCGHRTAPLSIHAVQPRLITLVLPRI